MGYNLIHYPCTVNNYLQGVSERTHNFKTILVKRPLRSTTVNINYEINCFLA